MEGLGVGVELVRACHRSNGQRNNESDKQNRTHQSHWQDKQDRRRMHLAAVVYFDQTGVSVMGAKGELASSRLSGREDV